MTGSQSPSDGDRIQEALEAAYREFATPPPPTIEGCPCCLETRGVDALLTTPLRELTGQALWAYMSGVFYTVGSVRDFKFLLPRILDVAIQDPGSSIDPEIVLTKVGLARWQSWPTGQRQAIEELVDAWFERALADDLVLLADDGPGWQAESILCGAARAGFSLARWLQRLQEPEAALVLADLKQRFPNDLSAFWEDAPAGLTQLADVIAPGR